MSVDQKAVDDMARILGMLNGTAPSPKPISESADETVMNATGSTGDPEIDAMKNILLRLREAAAPAVERLQEEAKMNSELRTAMVTEPTSRGARVGSWEIIVNEGSTKRYDVVNVATQEPIARDLYLYEAAYGLVKRLNEGVAINDTRVRDLLTLEEEYVKNREDAAVYKKQQKKLREKGEDDRAAIAEDRFDEARAKALDAQERILKLAGLR